VLGGYLVRAFHQAQGRPLYLLKQAPEESHELRLVEPRARSSRRMRGA
jgi:hypothetical protein